MSRVQNKYKNEVKSKLQEKFKYSNPMLIPSLKKIVISMGIAEASKDKNAVQDCLKEMTQLSGQKPILTKAKKAIANFKLRESQANGIKVTLRRKRMYDFFDRFCHIVSPRIRDFRGFPLKCDGRGSYSIGIQEQIIFPAKGNYKITIAQYMRTDTLSGIGNIRFLLLDTGERKYSTK